MSEQQRHECGKLGWAECVVCAGRFHLQGCTSRKNPKKDCCDKRHVNLYKQGIKVGMYDASIAMMPLHLIIDEIAQAKTEQDVLSLLDEYGSHGDDSSYKETITRTVNERLQQVV